MCMLTGLKWLQIFFSAFLLLGLSGQALAFTCGPNMYTYNASTGNQNNVGVRCAWFPTNNYTQMVWYGEGSHNGMAYRHVGEIYGNQASLFNLSGNGEQFSNRFDATISVTVTSVAANPRGLPNTLTLSGPVNETWTRVRPGIASRYLSRPPALRPVTTCGSNFAKYRVIDHPQVNASVPVRAGEGVRCFVRPAPGTRSTPVILVWYGDGHWGGGRYAHIGAVDRIGNPSTSNRAVYGAVDICDPSISGACGIFRPGTLIATAYGSTPTYYSRWIAISGAWSEDWLLNDPNQRP